MFLKWQDQPDDKDGDDQDGDKGKDQDGRLPTPAARVEGFEAAKANHHAGIVPLTLVGVRVRAVSAEGVLATC